MEVWVLEYTHRHGTDVIVCDTEEAAKVTALDLFLDNWSDFEDRKQAHELRGAVRYIAQQVIAKDIEGAINRLITVMTNEEKYGYDEGFHWFYRNASDSPTPMRDLVDNAINTIGLLEEQEEERKNAEEAK